MHASDSAPAQTTWSISVGATTMRRPDIPTSGVADPTTTRGTIGRGPKRGARVSGLRAMRKHCRPLALNSSVDVQLFTPVVPL
eukprot:2842814-Lingulodinium_polyedra.AAC.1